MSKLRSAKGRAQQAIAAPRTKAAVKKTAAGAKRAVDDAQKALEKAPSWRPKGVGRTVAKHVARKVSKAVATRTAELKKAAGEGATTKVSGAVSLGPLTVAGLARGAVQAGVPGTRGYAELVAVDRRRDAHARATGETWVKAEGELGATATLGAGGLSVGMTERVQARFVGAYPLSTPGEAAGSAVNAAYDGLKLVALPKDAQTLRDFDWAPGTELSLTETHGDHKGLELRGPALVAGYAYARPTAGRTTDTAEAYTKTYKQVGEERGDNHFFLQLGKQETRTVDTHVGVEVGAALPVAVTLKPPAQRVPAGPLPGQGEFPAEVVPPAAAQARGVTVATTLTSPALASVQGGRTRVTEHQVLAAAVLDLDTPEGAATFDHLNSMKVSEAAEWIKANEGTVPGGAVAVVDGSARTDHVAGKVLNATVLSASNTRGERSGVVWQAGKGETKLAEKYVATERKGFLYRLTNEDSIPRAFLDGVERRVEVAAGTLQRPGQAPTTALQVSLEVKDAKLLREEAAEWSRFATGMASTLTLPDAKKYGTAQISVGVAVDHAQLARLIELARKDPAAVTAAIGAAQGQIEGKGPPPWVADAASFEHRLSKLDGPFAESNPRDQARSDYRWDHPGRDFDHDRSSYLAAKLVAGALQELDPKDLDGFSKVLSAVGKQYSRDVRNVALGMQHLVGATLTKLQVSTEKAGTFAATPQAAAQDRLDVEVGALLGPP